MSAGFLLIDGSNIAHAANSAKPLSAGGVPTQAIYGFLRTLRPMLNTYSTLTPVVLWDGASWRAMEFAEYKASRKKVATSKSEIQAQLAKEDLQKQIPFIREALGYLGVRQMMALNYEADDLAGLLVEKYAGAKKIMMISGDKDWIQLIRPGVGWFDPIRDHRLTLTTLPTRLGFFPDKTRFGIGGSHAEGFVGVPSPRAWLEIKCLMGDTSDDIPGVGAIGPKRASEFIAAYGSFAAFMNMVADKTIDVDTLPKHFRDLAESDEKQELFRRNMRLMDLCTTERPTPVNLNINKGKLDPAAFASLCDRFLFNTIAGDLDRYLEPFLPKLEIAA